MKIRLFRNSLFLLLLAGCATSPLGRKQLILVPEDQMNEMGSQAFQKMKDSQPIDTDPQLKSYIQCIVDPLTVRAGGAAAGKNWEVVVFKSDQANAFALPGGKIGVYTGILQVAKTPSQLATVIGHEIGHVIAQHGAERVSQEMGTQLSLAMIRSMSSKSTNSDRLMSLIGLGAQIGILLPFSRAQESEADLIGLDLMARAGFDPHASVELWQNMIHAAGGKGPPSWLSTHPASETRIKQLQAHMTEAELKSNQAKGLAPVCHR